MYKKTKKYRFQKQMAYMDALFENAPEGIVLLDNEEIILRVNNEFLTLFGYSKEEVLGKLLNPLIVPEEYKEEGENLTRIAKGGKKINVESIRKRKDGTLINVSILGAPVNLGRNKIGVFAIYRDITDRKNHERALRNSEEKYRLVVENAREAIVIAQDGVLKYANPKASQIMGCKVEELLERPFIDFIHPQDREMVYQNYLKRIRGEKVLNNYTFRIINSEGNILFVQLSAVLISWENRPATLNFLIDITEKEKAEQNLRKKEEELLQTNKMDAIGRLAGGIAHDFNNLLTAITGYTDILMMNSNLDNTSIEYLGEIKKAADRAATLTKQLLAFSRKQILKPRIIELNRLISDLSRMLGRIIGEDIELKFNFQGGLGKIKVDPIQVEQVIMNLAVNARDAMRNGGTLTISTNNITVNPQDGLQIITPGEYVFLQITDTGQGMDENTKKHIFEPFFTTKKSSAGTGLGLSTVYGIIKQSEGYIFVNSEPEKGTTFKIYFPRVYEELSFMNDKTKSTEIEMGNETILLIEDEESVKNVISTSLIKLGYNVITAGSGEEALKLMGKFEKPPDLIITDVVLPGINGRKFVENTFSEFPEIKVLYISGYADNTIVHHGILYDDIPFLQKPFTPASLSHRIREILDRS